MRCIKTGLLIALLALTPAMVSADGVLTPAANPAQPFTLISSSGIPFIKASSGIMGNNGAVSAMTALPRTYSGGAYLYLPANAISAGSAAGWYWFVASSTTAGTVYNSTYTSGHPSVGVTTAFSTTGPGAFTGATGSNLAGPSLTIPGGLMGRNGRFMVDMGVSNNNSVNTKTTAVTFGGTACVSLTASSAINAQSFCVIQNRGRTNVQSVAFRYINQAGSVSSGHTADFSVDTAQPVAVTFTVQANTAATDHVIIEEYSVIVYSVN